MAHVAQQYQFDEQGMTWITCDLCSGSFQVQYERCAICDGTKLRRVSYAYLVAAATAATQPVQQNYNPPPPPKRDSDNKRDHDHGPRKGRKVNHRRT